MVENEKKGWPQLLMHDLDNENMRPHVNNNVRNQAARRKIRQQYLPMMTC